MELLNVTVTLEDGASGVYPLAAAAGLQAGYDHHIFLPLITDPYKEPPTRTPPAAPAGLKASLSEFSGFILKWTDRSSDETGFRIERRVSGVDSDYVELATVGRNTTEYFDSSSPIHYKKEYTYRVTAVGPAGNSKPAVVTFTAPAPPAVKPAAPADCWVEAITPTSAIFFWEDSSDNEEYFDLWIIQEAYIDLGWRPLARIEANATFVTVIDLVPNDLTGLSITAVNTAGESVTDCAVTFRTKPKSTSFRLVNHASYPINSILIDGVEQLPAYPLNVPPGSYYEIPLSEGTHVLQYTTGWWQDKDSRFNMYTVRGKMVIKAGDNVLEVKDPAITDLMTQFSEEGYWEGYYFDSQANCRTAAFRFFDDGTYVNYVSNQPVGSGKYLETGRNPNLFSVNFAVQEKGKSALEGVLNEIYGYFYLPNGPTGWKMIQYTYKPQGYFYNPFCP